MKIYEVFEIDHLVGCANDIERSVAFCSTLGKAIESARDYARISCDEINNSYAEGHGMCVATWTPSPCYGVAELHVLQPDNEEEIETYTYIVSERELR